LIYEEDSGFNDSVSEPRFSFLQTKDLEEEKAIESLICVYSALNKLKLELRNTEAFQVTPPWDSSFYDQTFEWKVNSGDFLVPNINQNISSQSKVYLVKRFSGRVFECAPLVFAHIRYQDGLNETEIANSFSALLSNDINNFTARYFGDSTIIYSSNKNFILKQISANEKKNLLSTILPAYHKHISTSSSNKSLLARILGIYHVKSKESYDLVLIKNFIPSEISLKYLYELKGSKLDRQVLSNSYSVSLVPEGSILKDLDFFQLQQSLHISFLDSGWLSRIILEDVNFLKSLGLVDYCLCIAVGEYPTFKKHSLHSAFARHIYYGKGLDASKVFVVGLVEFFKKSEDLDSRDKQVVSPEHYAQRFSKFVFGIVKCDFL